MDTGATGAATAQQGDEEEEEEEEEILDYEAGVHRRFFEGGERRLLSIGADEGRYPMYMCDVNKVRDMGYIRSTG